VASQAGVPHANDEKNDDQELRKPNLRHTAVVGLALPEDLSQRLKRPTPCCTHGLSAGRAGEMPCCHRWWQRHHTPLGR